MPYVQALDWDDDPPQTEPGDNGRPDVITDPTYTGAYWRAQQAHGDAGLPSNSSLSEVPNDSTTSSPQEAGFDAYNGNIAASETGGVVNVEWFYNQIVNAIENQMKFNQNSADKEMAFNADQAEINRKWQEYMQDSYYERMVASMKRAGLNPTLIGLGAVQSPSTPSGATASGSSASISSNSSAFNGLMSAIMDNLYEVFKMNDALNGWVDTFNKLIVGLLGSYK